jgi:hypothetical protein
VKFVKFDMVVKNEKSDKGFSFDVLTFKNTSSKGPKTNPNWLEHIARGKAIAQRDACLICLITWIPTHIVVGLVSLF